VNQRASALPRIVYVAFALVVLLAVVAFASRGHAPAAGDSGHARAPVQILFNVVFTLGLVAAVGMVVLIAFVRAQATERQRTVSFRSIIFIALGAALFMIGAVLYGQHLGRTAPTIGGAAGSAVSGAGSDAIKQADEPQFQWSIALGTVALLFAALLVVVYRERRRRRAQSRERALAERLADVLDETLDDLRAEPDARKAVIAAYARMEHALALHGLPRDESEAPLEYLARVLRDLRASEAAISGLTNLFAVAKFSHHPIDARMKEQAISALESVRDDLRAVNAEDRPPLERVPPEFEAAAR
jgi:MFS family permease